MTYAAIVRHSRGGIDIEMDLESSLTFDLTDYHYAREWGNLEHNERGSGPAKFTLNGTMLTIEAKRIGEHSYFYRSDHHMRATHPFGGFDSGLTIHVKVAHTSDHFRTHPEDDRLEHNPKQTGFLMSGQARYPVPCKWELQLGPGDDGVGSAIVYTDRYIRPGENFIFPDNHASVIRGIRPVYLRATGERVASFLTLGGIEPREAPASGCISEPPATIRASHTFRVCTYEPGYTYEWEAYDTEGQPVGSWIETTEGQATFRSPSDPQQVNIVLITTTPAGHKHVHGVRTWRVRDQGYIPVAIPQPYTPGDPVNRKRYEIDIRYADITLSLTGTDIAFATSEGIPITAPVVNPPIGPFRFWADGARGLNGRLEATVQGTVYTSLFTL